jgi:hypothetical protein
MRVQPSANHRVIGVIVDIALALPAGNALRLLPLLRQCLEQSSVLDFVAVDVAKLVRKLGEEGHPGEGHRLLVAMARLLRVRERDRSWDLEQLLGSVESVAAAGEPLGDDLYRLLKRTLPPRRLRKYSTMWLRNIDRKPRYGADARWMVANALYRFLLAAPLSAAVACAGTLFGEGEEVARRIALAAVADRRDLVDHPDPFLLDVALWDDEGSTRYEFRRALGAMWSRATKKARAALLKYAGEAVEADALAERAAAAGSDRSPDEIRRIWRGRLLHRIADDLPRAWLKRYGPLPPVEDDRMPEMIAEWGRDASPIAADALMNLTVERTLEFLATWNEPDQPTFDSHTLSGLASVAGEVVPLRLSEFAPHAPTIAGLRPTIVGAITSGVERALRADKLGDPGFGMAFVLGVVERIDADYDADWYRELLRDAAGCIEVGAHKGAIGEAAMGRALAFLREALERGPIADWHERAPSANWDAAMVALNTVRGDVTTALAELLIEAGRTNRHSQLDEASAILRHGISHPDGAISMRAAIGIRLPWILGHDSQRQAEWIEVLFGSGVQKDGRDACWQGYLVYSRLFRETVVLLDQVYFDAVNTFEAREADERQHPRDDLEQLGIHVAWAHLLAIPAEAVGSWLTTFYRRAPDWVRPRVTRWIAEQAAEAKASGGVRERARDFLRGRVDDLDLGGEQAELRAVSWCASAEDCRDTILEKIILPALMKTRGHTENERGTTELVARMATSHPGPAARALHLLVDGDEWHSLPHVAAEPLRRALEDLIASGDPEARTEAEATIHILGAQGFLEYRELLPPMITGDTRVLLP